MEELGPYVVGTGALCGWSVLASKTILFNQEERAETVNMLVDAMPQYADSLISALLEYLESHGKSV